MSYCIYCGSQVTEEDRFCANCGSQQHINRLQQEDQVQKQPDQKRHYSLQLLIFLLALIGIGIATYFLYFYDSPDDHYASVDADEAISESEVIPIESTLNVPDDFLTIQEALDNAHSGATIVVRTGTYYENIDFKGKEVILKSTDPTNPEVVKNTVIDGNNNGSVVSFLNGEGNVTRLDGFTIRGGSGTELSFIVSYLGERQTYNRIYGGGIIKGSGTDPDQTAVQS